MNRKIDKIKPAVNKNVLLLLAGFMWLAVGSLLVGMAIAWLHASLVQGSWIFTGTGVMIALGVHQFGFLKIVDNNLDRLLPMQGKKCLFAFITWKSYIIIAVMIALGIVLRHSPIPKPYLAVLYMGIGLALILSSIRYIRILLTQLKK